jgi:tetratricopeptide (TPR) repeat protein
MSRARELASRAVDELKRTSTTELASSFRAQAALREALMGNAALAKHQAEDALALSDNKYVEAVSAIALGLSGDPAKATRLADDLERRFPENTSMKFHYLPMIRGAIATKSGNTRKAIKPFEVGALYELGGPSGMSFIRLYPVYLRGQAYLEARQSAPAVAEFQKILDHFGLVANEPIGALAYLGLGRAQTITGDSAKARTAYQDFFALWKNADPDVPLLKQAKAEYEKLR